MTQNDRILTPNPQMLVQRLVEADERVMWATEDRRQQEVLRFKGAPGHVPFSLRRIVSALLP